MTITAITYPCNDDSFGKDGATEAEQAGYRAYLAKFLAENFSGAVITIDRGDCARLIVETDDGSDQSDEVREAADYAWSVCRWEWVPPADAVVIEYMPVALRASHVKAGNRGTWPDNGGERVAVPRALADSLSGHEWVRVVPDVVAADYDYSPNLDVEA